MSVREALLTVGGLGNLRPAPGTWGSFPAAALAGLLMLLETNALTYHLVMIAVCMLACVVCVALGRWAEDRWGRKDPSPVVADETAGQCVALLGVPLVDPSLFEGALVRGAIVCAAAFVLFRLLDIWKPQPANAAQRLPAGWGILVDDLIAGAYAALALNLALWAIV